MPSLYAVMSEEKDRQSERIRKLQEENEQLKRQVGNLEHTKDFCDEVCADCERLEKENEELKIALKDKENLISICEKKFKELGYLITCDDDGYVIE